MVLSITCVCARNCFKCISHSLSPPAVDLNRTPVLWAFAAMKTVRGAELEVKGDAGGSPLGGPPAHLQRKCSSCCRFLEESYRPNVESLASGTAKQDFIAVSSSPGLEF